jgi:chromosome condensin MukBEF ATPase and DNA-binding subunit MukB
VLLRKELEKVEALLLREQEASQREREAVQREQERVADLEKRLDQATEERRLAEERNHALMLRLMPPSPSAPQPVQEPPPMVEELRRRLEESEAHVRALVTAAPPAPQAAQERPSQVPAGTTPAGSLRGLLARLLGR